MSLNYRWRSLLTGIVIFFAGFFIGQFWHPGFFLHEWYPGYFLQQLIAPANGCAGRFPLTSPSLDCTGYEDSAARLKAVDDAIDSADALYIKEGKASTISVWVRDMESRQNASDNENQRYDPASLLKLPLMIAYFKVAELDPTILKTMIPYTDTGVINNATQDIAPSSTLVVGQSYTVEQLIEDMIINSNNNAAAALLAHLDPTIFTNTALDLGIKIPSSDNTDLHDLVNAKTYSTIFRMLYSASYLNRADSEKALEIMSKVKFPGLTAELPPSVKVAHKFGEREVQNSDGSVQVRELHDCGIVYKEDNPYSICIMTQGKSFADLQSVVEHLSKLVYDRI